MAGKNVTSKHDQLQKIKIEYLYHKLSNPNAEIQARIRQLRIVRDLDSKQYGLLKRQLPYVVCGMFNPPIRHSENFGYTEYFIVDIDHVSQKDMDINTLRSTLEADERVMLCFLSPGEDGLKLLFKLTERCYDAGMYSIFYKAFVLSLSKQYGLLQVMDARTSDVARACFVSIDPHAYYNTEAEMVDMKAFLQVENNDELFAMRKKTEAQLHPSTLNNNNCKGPDDEALMQIKQLLNPKAMLPKREVHVPEQLNEVMLTLVPIIEKAGVQLYEVINISYGKKLKMKMGIHQAEINLFYGQKGYSVVISGRSGTNGQLNSLMAQLIEQTIFVMPPNPNMELKT